MTKAHWEHFQHMADIGVRGFGETLPEAFEQGAYALIAIISDLCCIEPIEQIELECSAPDREILFYDWINKIVFEIATRNFLFNQFRVTISDLHLKATLVGEPIVIEKHKPTVEVKGATFTLLKVEQRDDEWIAQCVVDV